MDFFFFFFKIKGRLHTHKIDVNLQKKFKFQTTPFLKVYMARKMFGIYGAQKPSLLPPKWS